MTESFGSRVRRSVSLWRVELVLGVIYVLLFLALDARHLNYVSPDTASYVNQAHSLLSGHGFAENGLGYYQPEFFRTPLYANFLAFFIGLFGDAGLGLSVWVQRLAWGCIVLFAFPACGRRQNRWAALLAVVGKSLALYSPQVMVNVSLLLTDTLFACLVALSFRTGFDGLARVKWVRIVAGGILLGLATLARPAGQYIAFCVAAVAVLWGWFRFRPALVRRAALPALVFLVVSLALPLGWCARNYALSGHFTITPSVGIYLCWHRTPSISRLVDRGVDFGGPLENEYARLVRDTQSSLDADLALRSRHKMTIFDTDPIARRVGLKAIALEPAAYVAQTVYYCLGIYAAPADAQTFLGVLLGPRESLTTPLGQAVRERKWEALIVQGVTRATGIVLLLLVPAVIAFWGWRTRRLTMTGWLYLAAACYFTVLSSAATTTYGRFLLPILPSILYLYCVLPSESREAD